MGRRAIGILAATAVGATALAAAGAASAKDYLGVACSSPPPAHCSGEACEPMLGDPGNAVDPKTGRKFWLDYPCDLKPGDKVVFILNIHGAGSIGQWQRHYFPAMDYKDKYKLVVATPTAATSRAFPGAAAGAPGVRVWVPEADDAHLQNITDLVFDAFGRKNIKSFWLAGHSQGGATSHRIVCSDFFKDKVDGLLSLSGGRVGRAEINPRFGPPKPDGSPPDARPPGAGGPLGGANLPTCQFSHIFETGEHEIVSLPTTSPLADQWGCAARVEEKDVVDDQPGYVWDYARQGYPVWGMKARPGSAHIWVYPKCKGGRVVADVVRVDKGHTEGLEPHVTEAIIRLMVAAPGGKAQHAS